MRAFIGRLLAFLGALLILWSVASLIAQESRPAPLTELESLKVQNPNRRTSDMAEGASFPAGQRFITASELDARDEKLEHALEALGNRLSSQIAANDENQRTRFHTLNSALQVAVGDLGLVAHRVTGIEDREKDARTVERERRAVNITIAGLMSGIVFGLIEIGKALWSHKP